MSGMIKKTLCAASVGIGLSLAYFASATAPDSRPGATRWKWSSG